MVYFGVGMFRYLHNEWVGKSSSIKDGSFPDAIIKASGTVLENDGIPRM